VKALVTGSSGHLGEALVMTLRRAGVHTVGVDLSESEYTDVVGSVFDRSAMAAAIEGVHVVLHAATLHKPHIVTHSMQDFVDTNIAGTLVLLEEAVRAGVESFVFTSSTSVFGHALRSRGDSSAVWVTEDLQPIPKNIYGITKIAAENLCELFHGRYGLNCVVLRTARFFPDEDDSAEIRSSYTDANSKANEFLFRRADLEDVVSAHILAAEYAKSAGFERFIVSATTPFQREDLSDLRVNAAAVVQKYFPRQKEIYEAMSWKLFPSIERVYDNSKARRLMGWQPKYDYQRVLDCLVEGADPRSDLARAVGSKGYHSEVFEDGPYPVE
jgi:nucleoside-diphosphate-sugar epimerase